MIDTHQSYVALIILIQIFSFSGRRHQTLPVFSSYDPTKKLNIYMAAFIYGHLRRFGSILWFIKFVRQISFEPLCNLKKSRRMVYHYCHKSKSCVQSNTTQILIHHLPIYVFFRRPEEKKCIIFFCIDLFFIIIRLIDQFGDQFNNYQYF